MGFEPMNRGFADLYNRPLCQGATPLYVVISLIFSSLFQKNFAIKIRIAIVNSVLVFKEKMLLTYKSAFASLLASYFQLAKEDLLPLIQMAPDNIKGDLAFPCFQFAKSLGKAPNVIANEVFAFLQKKNQTSSLFSEFYAVGPYVNVSFNTQVLAPEVLQQIKKEKN